MKNTYSKLKEKDVVNVCSGRRLGNISDLEIDLSTGKISKLIVPGGNRCFNLFGSKNTLRIPWECIEKIGDDTILVRIPELPPGKRE